MQARHTLQQLQLHGLLFVMSGSWQPSITSDHNCISLSASLANVVSCRQLAELEEEEGLLLTPFERNLEVWRQLWRVLERSDIVVQVGTATRACMGFLCTT